jgi:peptide/nickel transport system substrate-binding protein
MKNREKTVKLIRSALFATALCIAPTAAFAQKSKDTLRMSLDEPVAMIDQYHFTGGESTQFSARVYDGLIAFNEYERKFVPALAKSWQRIDATTIDFDLRNDIKFHSGNPFDADDVVYTLNYVADPAVKLQFKNRYDWIKEVQKIGPYKIRIIAKEPDAMIMALLAYRLAILDSKIHKTLDTKSDYGRVSASGTGILKVISVESNKGVTVERNESFRTGDTKYYLVPMKKIVATLLPDNQTKIAQFLTGGVDMIRNISPDNAKELAKNPKIDVSYLKSGEIVYLALDGGGVSDNKALADPRVRQAIWQSVDRDSIIKHIVPGGPQAEKMSALCLTSTAGCKWTKPAMGYDLAAAKRLLAEAGYPNGFEFNMLVVTRIKEIAEAMAGDMLKAGIRATVEPTTINNFRRVVGQNKMEAALMSYPAGNFPDAGNHLEVLFGDVRAKYQGNDAIISGAMEKGASEFDPEKRADFYAAAFDRSNEMFFTMGVTSLPYIIAHTKEVKVLRDTLSAGTLFPNNYAWK